MKVQITPPVEREVTITMTEDELSNIRYILYLGTIPPEDPQYMRTAKAFVEATDVIYDGESDDR